MCDRDTLLFFDDEGIAHSKNLRRVFHQPTKSVNNPQLRPERPYEAERLQVWGSVYRWENRWRVLGNTWGATPDSRCRIFALESEDGLEWYRPNLGLHTVGGTRDNNILIDKDPDGSYWYLPSLIEHPHPPDERWRYLLYAWRSAPSGPEPRAALYVFRSEDGLHFTRAKEAPVLVSNGYYGPNNSNDVVMVYYDRQAGCFTLYAAVMLPVPPGMETRWDNCSANVRYLAQWQSDDGVHWQNQRLMLAPDRQEPEWQQYYGVTVSEYEGFWLGFPLYYHVREQFMQPHMILSRDRLHWERPTRHPFLPCGDSPDRWDYGTVMLAWDFLRRENDLVFLYSGGQRREHTNRFEMAFGTAILRRDGFASVSPGGAEALDAELTTVPLHASPGRRVLLNTMPDWREDAWLEVEVQDASGCPLAGYGFAESGRIVTDAVKHVVHWNGKDRLPANRGPLRVRIHLHQQRLFAIRVTE